MSSAKTAQALAQLEDAVQVFLEDYKDCFPEMKFSDHKVVIPLEDGRTWTLLMSVSEKKTKADVEMKGITTSPSTPVVEAHPHRPWDWGLLSANPPNITMRDIETNPDKH